MRLPRRQHKRQITEIVAEACRLVDSDEDVRRVHIVTRGRPTYDQMRRYQRAALHSRTRLTVDREGVITVRPDGT